MTATTALLNRSARSVLTSALPKLDLSPAALRVLATAPVWWERRARANGITTPAHIDVHQAVDARCPVTAKALAAATPRDDLFDATPEQLGDAYVAALTPEVRGQHGRHYTPPLLAQEIWTQTVAQAGGAIDGLVLDPACGAGALLLPPLREWLAHRPDTAPTATLASAESAIAGRDLDAAAVWLGSVLLASELLPVWRRLRPSRRRPLPALLSVADGLSEQTSRATAVVMNPPYGRRKLDPEDRARWAHVLSGHANIYSLFIAAAIKHTAPGGTVTALVPAGWLGGLYFTALRKHLVQQAPPTRIAYVTEREGVFSSDVLQETVIATFAVGRSASTLRCDRLTVNGHADRRRIGVTSLPTDPTGPWLLPRDPGDNRLIAATARMPHRLTDHGWRVSTGPLVWNRVKDQITAQDAPGAVPILWAADIEGGEIHRDATREHQRYWQPRTDDERAMNVLRTPAVLVQRTTSTDQPRRLVSAVMDAKTLAAWGGEVVVENHVNVIRIDRETNCPPRLLHALLSHADVDRVFRCLSGSVAVSASELHALPLPSPEVIGQWADLDGESLATAIAAAYGAERA